MGYEIAKFAHVTGVVMLMGNITTTAIWKFFADRSGNAVVAAFGQRLVTLTDWSLTFWGILLTIGGGYAMAYLGGWSLLGERWLLLSQGLFILSGLMWLGLLVPLQVRMARAARAFVAGEALPASYRRDSRAWLFWGLVATAPLVAVTWLMVAKPS